MIKTENLLDLLKLANEAGTAPTYLGPVDFLNNDKTYKLEDKESFAVTIELPKRMLKNTKALTLYQFKEEGTESLVQHTLDGKEKELTTWKLGQ